MLRTRTGFAVLTLAAAAAGQGITLAEGSSFQDLAVAVLDEANPAAPGTTLLANASFLPVEISARTADQELRTERSRRITRHGLQRLELPGGGRVFHYQQPDTAPASLRFGLLHVPPDGRAAVVLQRAGTGPYGSVYPFLDRFALSPDGRHLLAPSALGGFDVVRLDGGTFASTGRADRFVQTPAPLLPTSMLVGRSQACYQTADGRLWRCPLADGGQPVDCTPPPAAGAFLKEEMALSGDGSTVAFLYGPRDQQRIYLLREAGAAVVLPPPPSKYEEPDYLPEGSGHPHLLLNEDGTRLLYVDGLVRDELFLLDVAGALPSLQITADPVFQPYIGVHILPSFAGPTLYTGIGDPNRMDWFRIVLAAGGGQVTNLTGTGSLQQPFPSGTLDPLLATRTGNVLLATEAAAGGLQLLRRIDLSTGATAVLHGDLLGGLLAGSALSGPADLVARGQGGDRLFLGQSGLQLAATPPGLLLLPPNRGPQYSGTWLHLAGGIGLVVLFLPDGTAIAGPVEQGVEQVVLTLAGGCVLTGASPRYLAVGVYQPLNRPPAAVRICLSGAGG